MNHLTETSRARFREPGSVILREFKAAMEHARAGGQAARLSSARGFDAAQASPFTAGWASWSASINALLQSMLPVLVSRSRQWSRNTGPGRRFLDLVRNGSVGPTGYTLQMRCGDWRKEQGRWVFRLDKVANDAIEIAFAEWCARGNCEVTGRLSFADVCKLLMETCARDGEYLAKHLRATKANRFRYQLQLLSTDRLDVHHNETPVGAGNEVRMGVHRDETGRARAYSILRFSPGDARTNRQAEVVPADQVLHDFISLDAEQARGVPWSHATLLGSNMLAQFENFAVFAAQVGASQQGFFEQPAEQPIPVTTQDLGAAQQANGDMVRELVPGAIDLLPPGVKFAQFSSQYPSDAFGPFVTSRKQDIAAGLSVAHHNLTGDMTKVNYSSARIAELAERDHWRGVSHWFIGSFVFPVFKAWLEMALLSNQITLPGGQALSATRIDKYLAGVIFRGRGWDWVDPQKEVNAAKTAVEEGFTTRSQVVAARGGDFEDNVVEIAQEQQILADNGVRIGGAAPAPAPHPADGTPEDNAEDSSNAAAS